MSRKETKRQIKGSCGWGLVEILGNVLEIQEFGIFLTGIRALGPKWKEV